MPESKKKEEVSGEWSERWRNGITNTEYGLWEVGLGEKMTMLTYSGAEVWNAGRGCPRSCAR